MVDFENSDFRSNNDNHISKFKPKIVSIGGGTGLSTMLRAIKKYTTDITAVVTVSDDGGGSGVLRDDLNMPPPGDVRNCIMALSHVEPVMESLLTYRFDNGSLSGQSFGNLFLAAMTEMFDGDFVKAVRNVCRVLNITGKVFPVTATNVDLVATLESGRTVVGESNIGKSIIYHNSPIKKVRLIPKTDNPISIEPLTEILEEISQADLITIGPGSLYTSILPNLVVHGLAEAIHKADAPVVYINNIMTQPGETEDYTAFDHVLAILDHTFEDFIDYCIINNSKISKELREKYNEDNSVLVPYDKERFSSTSIKTVERNLFTVNKSGHIRHNTQVLSDTLLDILSINRNEQGLEISDEGVVLYKPKKYKRQ